MTSMVIDMPHTPSELVVAFANRDIEIDIRKMSDNDAEILTEFLIENKFKPSCSPYPILDSIMAWRNDYGILVADSGRGMGANHPYLQFGTVRLTIKGVMEILQLSAQLKISDEDFDSVF